MDIPFVPDTFQLSFYPLFPIPLVFMPSLYHSCLYFIMMQTKTLFGTFLSLYNGSTWHLFSEVFCLILVAHDHEFITEGTFTEHRQNVGCLLRKKIQQDCKQNYLCYIKIYKNRQKHGKGTKCPFKKAARDILHASLHRHAEIWQDLFI